MPKSDTFSFFPLTSSCELRMIDLYQSKRSGGLSFQSNHSLGPQRVVLSVNGYVISSGP